MKQGIIVIKSEKETWTRKNRSNTAILHAYNFPQLTLSSIYVSRKFMLL